MLGNPDDGVYPYRAMLSFRSPVLRRFINHPELVELVMGLLGPDLRLWWDQGINKAPGSGSVIPWHQDNAYSPGRVPEYVTTWLALDDSDAANGDSSRCRARTGAVTWSTRGKACTRASPTSARRRTAPWRWT